DDCKFLSFEEWKKLKEADTKAPLSKAQPGGPLPNQQAAPLPQNASSSPHKPEQQPVPEDQGRVYKDKFNYASGDCAATIVETNSDAKGAAAILTEVKDSYLLNKCLAASQFVVIELCQDILVGSVVMGNFELFSLMFRTVKFSVADRFPATQGWHDLGLFEAQNIRAIQTFDIASPLIWARYLKIEVASHYGNEFYCPISLVRVHGKTMMEEIKDSDRSTQPAPAETSRASPAQETPAAAFGWEDGAAECKVRGPFLALDQYLRDLNYSANYCDVPMMHTNVSHPALPETASTKPTQESIFQNIVKRLALLERNATLSLLYVEEQSKLLLDAFFNLENRQVRKFEHLLAHINETMYTQVHYLERAVGQIKSDSISMFRAQSAQALRSITGLRQETRAFAGEISFLRKLVVADTLIILALLVYVIGTRE
ncbi:hypothetical protein METBIDRAFT_20034, partial [Metschnikowia bicuspidata var. bicuspidata NRRL YB-4993]